VSAIEAEIIDVGLACFADSEPVQAEQYLGGGVLAIDAFCVEREPAELARVEATAFRLVDLASADVLRRVRGDAPVDVREPVEPAHRRQSRVDRRRGQAALFHVMAVQPDVRRVAASTWRAESAAQVKSLRRSWR
jgi:hypothetical protein